MRFRKEWAVKLFKSWEKRTPYVEEETTEKTEEAQVSGLDFHNTEASTCSKDSLLRRQ